MKYKYVKPIHSNITITAPNHTNGCDQFGVFPNISNFDTLFVVLLNILVLGKVANIVDLISNILSVPKMVNNLLPNDNNTKKQITPTAYQSLLRVNNFAKKYEYTNIPTRITSINSDDRIIILGIKYLELENLFLDFFLFCCAKLFKVFDDIFFPLR
jgi:hypothetical protein